jgi:hypothetical protein
MKVLYLYEKCIYCTCQRVEACKRKLVNFGLGLHVKREVYLALIHLTHEIPLCVTPVSFIQVTLEFVHVWNLD